MDRIPVGVRGAHTVSRVAFRRMTHSDLERLAEACERAAERLAVLCFYCSSYDNTSPYLCDKCEADQLRVDLLRIHARAIRAGRVSVKEDD